MLAHKVSNANVSTAEFEERLRAVFRARSWGSLETCCSGVPRTPRRRCSSCRSLSGRSDPSAAHTDDKEDEKGRWTMMALERSHNLAETRGGHDPGHLSAHLFVTLVVVTLRPAVRCLRPRE